MFPGMGGSNNGLYTTKVAQDASKLGYITGIPLMRACCGIPITSYKLSCSTSWDDVKAIIDYVYQKYVVDAKTGAAMRPFYAYGVSLGAQ